MLDKKREAAVWERVRAAAWASERGPINVPVRQNINQRKPGGGKFGHSGLPLVVLLVLLVSRR